MIGGIGDATKIPELRKRALVTLLLLIVYRVGVFVPTPGIDAERLADMFQQASATLFGMMNMFTGGALEQFSVFALGIMPYISVSIIIQIMTKVVPSLEALSKEGEQGRRTITRYTRIGTIVLAVFQGLLISSGLESQGVVSNPGWAFRIETAITLAAGTAFIMWLGEQITERGVGNGISLIIMAGILARMPATVLQTFDLMGTGEITPFSMLGIFAFGVGTIGAIVYVERAQRKIPVHHPKKVVGGRMATQAQTQYLPFKVNNAGVIPPIFASVLISFPLSVAQMADIEALQDGMAFLTQNQVLYYGLFAALIIFFCYFYVGINFDPVQLADNLKKGGGFIPTVRPGKDTSEFLNGILSRLTVWGSIYVCIICIAPEIFYQRMGAVGFSYFFGGTAVLIVVGVTLDTLSQVESHMMVRNYEGFMSKSPTGKGRGRGGFAGGGQSQGRLIQR